MLYTQELCTGIKAEDIDVYTVAYKCGAGTTDSQPMLKDGATKPEMFFDSADAAELEKDFEDIGRSLFEIRLSK